MASRARARTRPAPAPRPWTRADLARLPDDGNRYEVLDGCLLVTPQASRDHQKVATQLVVLLERYVRHHGVAHVVGPGAVLFGEHELQPDIQVIPGPPQPGDWADGPDPVLVVEVLSRSTRHRDFGVKLDAYLARVRVPVVWIVDRQRRDVHVYEPGAKGAAGTTPRVVRDELQWLAPGAPEPLRIDLPAFFTDALGASS